MKCQDCQIEISIPQGSNKAGDIIDCNNCGAEYEVVNSDPLRLELIEEEK